MTKQKNPILIGLLQGLGVSFYCLLVALFFRYMGKFADQPDPQPATMLLVLLLLVFSAAITGLIVFGYPVYLTLHKHIKEALQILGYTFIFMFMIIAIIVWLVF